MHSGTPLCSILAAVFMASPKRQNLKFFVPTMPLMQVPVWIPTRSGGMASVPLGQGTLLDALMMALAYPIICKVFVQEDSRREVWFSLVLISSSKVTALFC